MMATLTLDDVRNSAGMAADSQWGLEHSSSFVHDNATYQKQLRPTLHSGQLEIRANAKRFNVIVCGRRFGKSILDRDLIEETALAGHPAAYCTPQFAQLNKIWKSVKEDLRSVTKYKNDTRYHLELTTGGEIDCWAIGQSEGSLGNAYKRIVIDEAARLTTGDIWLGQMRPMLTDMKGDAWFTTTPRGHNWLWNLYNRGQDPLVEDWYSVRKPTTDNPTIEGLADEVESARQELPDRLFRQEYLAEFIEDAGGVFRGVSAVSTAAQLMGAVGGVRYVAGIDWGKDNDFTVISVWDSAAKREVFIERINQVGWEFQYTFINRICKMFAIQHVLAERNSIGSPNIEALQRKGLPVQGFDTTAQSKGPMIESLALAIESRECELQNDKAPDGAVALAEAQAYELERLPSGRFRYGAPDGTHDDTVVARALGWKAIGRQAEVKIGRWA